MPIRGGTRKGGRPVPAAVLVFVYGTLTDRERLETVLRGGGDEDLPTATPRPDGHEPLEDAFRGPATLDGCHRVDGRYPTLAPGGSVDGRLLALEADALGALDRYEGVDRGLYVRVAVPLSDGERSAWTYVGDPAKLGVGDAVTWPDPSSSAASFEERVRSHVTDRCAVRPRGDP